MVGAQPFTTKSRAALGPALQHQPQAELCPSSSLSSLTSLYCCFCFPSTARFLGHPCLCASYITPMCPEERKIPSNPAAL